MMPAPHVIDSFQGEYRWLSNFWPAPVFYEGRLFPSVENAYQAAKLHPSQRGQFLQCSAAEAKRAGRRGQIRPGWDTLLRMSTMRNLIAQKFSAGSDLGARLLATGGAHLIEGNTWGDRFWGVCRGEGENRLGEMLMARRTEIGGRPRQ